MPPSTGPDVPVNKDQRHRCLWAAEDKYYLARKQGGPPSGANVQGTFGALTGQESGDFLSCQTLRRC